MKDEDNKCKCCNGRGVQENKKTGLTQPCPYCNGTGNKSTKKRYYYSDKEEREFKEIKRILNRLRTYRR